MSRDESYLAAKVQAVNEANKYTNELYTKLTNCLRPFVGKKVVNQNGRLSSSLEKAIESLNLPGNSKMHVYCSSYRAYSLSWVVKISYTVGEFSCNYYETSINIAKMTDHVIAELYDTPPAYRTDFTVEEIQTKRETYKVLKAKAEEAQGEIPYQFRD